MRVAAIERFADASRRCDPGLLGLAPDDVATVDLPDPLREPGTFLRGIPGAIRDWVAVPGSMRERIALARASMGTRGARAGALLRAPELLGRIMPVEIPGASQNSLTGVIR